MVVAPRLGTPRLFCQRCSRVWRGAINFFLLLIHFCGSQSPSWLFPLARYWQFSNQGSTSLPFSRNATGSVKQRITYKILLFPYKSLHSLAPKYITDLQPYSQSQSLCSTCKELLSIPQTKLIT